MANDADGWLTGLAGYIADLSGELEAARSENVKLRELAYVSLNFCANGYCEKEYGCPMNSAESDGRCGFAKACRELGIEESE